MNVRFTYKYTWVGIQKNVNVKILQVHIFKRYQDSNIVVSDIDHAGRRGNSGDSRRAILKKRSTGQPWLPHDCRVHWKTGRRNGIEIEVETRVQAATRRSRQVETKIEDMILLGMSHRCHFRLSCSNSFPYAHINRFRRQT